MIKKIEWISTLLALLCIIITIFTFLTHRYTLEEFINQNRPYIIFVLVPVFVVLYTVFILKTRQLLKASKTIYVSYSHGDKKLAEYIIKYISGSQKIKKNNMIVLSDHDIKYGEDICLRIKKDISNAGTVVLVVSEAYMNSESCANEFKYMLNERPRIIPIFLEPVSKIKDVFLPLQNYKGVILNQDAEDDINAKLNDIIKDITD